MPDHAWMFLAIVLLIPPLVVGLLRFVMKKEDSTIDGTGCALVAFISFAASLWVIFDKLA